MSRRPSLAEGHLTAWQNKPSSPTSTDSFLYDGEGNRVAQQSASGGVTTQSVYVGSLMEARTVTGGPGTGNITYYSASGKRIALMNNGTLSYLVGDHLGSTVETLDSTGNVSGSQLYGPYGASRYSTGSMVTDYGFTAQRADSTTGLDYYNARYYDPAPGQFTSADTVRDGQNRFGYVGGNPTTSTDPSGQQVVDSSTQAAFFGGGGWAQVAAVGAIGSGIVLCLAACARAFSWVRDNWRSNSSYGDDSRTAAVTSNAVLDHWWTDSGPWSTNTTDGDGTPTTKPTTGNPPGATTAPTTATGTGGMGPDRGPCGGPPTSDYEDMVKAHPKNNDPTVNEPNSHQWNGSQPARNANGGVDTGWAGPDVIRNYGGPGETWIETKQVLPGEEVITPDSRPMRQLNDRYAPSGWPFEYWFTHSPGAETLRYIEEAGGKVEIWPTDCD